MEKAFYFKDFALKKASALKSKKTKYVS